MRSTFRVTALLAAGLTGIPVRAQPPTPVQAPTPAESPVQDLANFQVDQLFASTCGFCHSDGGRAAGRAPQLMGTQRDDDFIRNRIKNGKPGAMPAFGASFTDEQVDAIIIYIRDLRPR